MMRGLLDYTSKIQTNLPHIQASIATIDKALATHSVNNLWFSLNAGKDNMVCFYLLCFVLKLRLDAGLDTWPDPEKFPINFIYFHEKEPFPESITFMQNLEKMLDLNVVYYPNPTNQNRHKVMIDGLQHIVTAHKMKSIILGIRRTDPWSAHLTDFALSDTHKGWPDFVRVLPILEWRYQEIWDF